MAAPDISLIIPVYQDAATIGETVDLLAGHLATQGVSAELILVHDGGPEETRQALRRIAEKHPQVHIVDRDVNRGKGYSVREGLATATGTVLIYTDADLPYDLASLERVMDAIRHGTAEVAVASRRIDPTERGRHQNALRRLAHDTFATLVSTLFQLSCTDTQAGLKALTPAVRDQVLPQLTIDRYSFDVELLHAAQRFGFRLRDVPVTRREVEGTNVRIWNDSWNMVADLWRIWRRRHRYGPSR